MMRYVLDTDTLSYLMRGREDVSRRFAETASRKSIALATTIFNHSELWYGSYLAKLNGEKTRPPGEFLGKFEILPYSASASDSFASIKATLEKKGQLIKDMDMLIASIAMVNRATLVTSNTRHFSRIEGLKLENWARAA